MQPGRFKGGGGSLKKGRFDKHLMWNTPKKGSAGKHFGESFPRYT